MYEHDWYRMNFNADFYKTLHKYGRLPFDSVEKQMGLFKQLDEKDKTIKELMTGEQE